MAERIAHPFTLSLALTFYAVLHLNRREPERALSLVEAVEALAAEQRLSLTLEPGIVHGAALSDAGLLFCRGTAPHGSSPKVWRGTAIGRRPWPP
jgi:hypothetical protein